MEGWGLAENKAGDEFGNFREVPRPETFEVVVAES